MVTTVASLLIGALAGGGFVTPQHVISNTGYVWSMNDLFHDPMRTPHPQGGRVLAAAGDASGSAYILSHDRNIEMLVYGTSSTGSPSFNQTDAPRELRNAGTLRMWSLSGGRYFVQSDSKELAWTFDSVKQWRPANYLPGLKAVEPYGSGVATFVKAATSKTEPTLKDPATAAKDKATKPKPKKVARFVFVAVTGEQDLAPFATENPDFTDRVVEVELPENASVPTTFVPVASDGFVVLRSGKRGLVYSTSDASYLGEIDLAQAVGATIVKDAGQYYGVSFGAGGRPQVSRLSFTAPKVSE